MKTTMRLYNAENELIKEGTINMIEPTIDQIREVMKLMIEVNDAHRIEYEYDAYEYTHRETIERPQGVEETTHIND